VAKSVREALGEEVAREVSPHTQRHTFITLALEAGTSLRRVQYAAGHADPRTTERYDRARQNLTDNATDYVARVLAEEARGGHPDDAPVHAGGEAAPGRRPRGTCTVRVLGKGEDCSGGSAPPVGRAPSGYDGRVRTSRRC